MKLINVMWIVLGEAYSFMVRLRASTMGWVHFIRCICKTAKSNY